MRKNDFMYYFIYSFFAMILFISGLSVGKAIFNRKIQSITVELPKTSPIQIEPMFDRKDPIYAIPAKYNHYVNEICELHEVPVWVFARLIQRESNWRWDAINDNGDSRDLGIAQLNSKYINYYSKYTNEDIDPFNPYQSLLVSVQILKHLYDETGSWMNAVAAYNVGLTGFRNGRFPENHVDAIFGGE